MRWIRRTYYLLLVLLVLAALGIGVYTQRVRPVVDGRIELAGALEPIRIERDDHGVPTIHAGSLHDAMFGLGVVHAQDRLWQLETHKRIGSGRVAEAFGDAALDTDRFLRALGVRRAAQAQWDQLGGDSRTALLAYSAGINAVLKDQLRALPPEFLILGLKPDEWTPVDSLAWAVMMAWDLGGNWNNELHRLRLSLQMPVARVNDFLPPYPGDVPLQTRDYAALYRELGLGAPAVQQSWNRLPDIAPESGVEGVGSNNWVLAGSRTDTGKPLLANDPHLKLSAPALWYLARIKAPGLDVGGATMPGLPLVVVGQNARLAWGLTNTGPDVQDLYIEAVEPGAPGRYRTPDGHADFEVFDEVIKVKGKPDVSLRARRTRHGPVISDAGTLGDVADERHVLAMRWPALDADADPIGVGLGLMRAASVAEFFAAAEGWVAPMQNMVVGDVDGAIGFVAPARVPLRKPENDLRGLAPAPGWEARYDWAGWVPASETPRETDPARGWIATANQRVTAPDYPHFITSEWTLPYRQQRIEQLLAERDRHSLDDLARQQADVKSLAAAPLLPWLHKAAPPHALLGAARQQLAGFDGTMAADRAAPLIYWAWFRHLGRAVLADEAGALLFEKSFATRSFQDTLELVLGRDDAWWCDDKATPAAETCAQMNDKALGAALDELLARYGPEVANWRWGQAHQARAEHRPFSKVKALAGLFELRAPTSGDTYTVAAARVTLKPDAGTGELYLNEHSASYRGVYDIGDRSHSRVMQSSGQSGIPLTGSYRSFVEPWSQVRYVPLWPAGAAAATGGTLKVTPAPR